MTQHEIKLNIQKNDDTISLMTNVDEKTGFRNPRCVDISVTSLEEQRSTEWMRFQSLANFLAPDGRTIEGHAPPTRAVIIAQRI